MLFTSNAAEFAANTPFRVKMGLIALAGLNALVFHRNAYAQAVARPHGEQPPVSAVAAATFSICLWLGVITAGRMIAYLD